MIGTRIAHYEITAKLGEGGMGEVYRATDTKLNRAVALKILPEQFAADSQRMGRFQREAEVLASLSHSNIGTIYGIEDFSATKALVLELIEGPTLADRIAGEPIALDEAISIALQIAEGLDAAHEKGVIHRDLKPANIKLTPEGQVKILDFGLARIGEEDDSERPARQLTHSPTLSLAATQAGVILGTAAYMAPEQAKGQRVDKRADVWSFGVILYEMLAGVAPFRGQDLSEILAAVLATDPDLRALPSTVPSHVSELIVRCLQRDPSERLRDIGDARFELRKEPGDDAETVTSSRFASPAALSLIGILTVASAVLAVLSWWPSETTGPMTRASLTLPPGHVLVSGPEISRNGRRIAFASSDGETRQRIYTRRLEEDQLTVLAGTEEADQIFFSPDGRWLAFYARGQLFKVNVEGGAPVPLVNAASSMGAYWLDDGRIVFTPTWNGGLYIVAENGGEPQPLLIPDRVDEYALTWPHGLGPDQLLFARWGREKGLSVLDLGDRSRRIIAPGLWRRPQVTESGHILTTSNAGDLLALPIDALTEPGLTPEPMISNVHNGQDDGYSHFSISATGTLVYAPLDQSRKSLVFVDHSGRTTPVPAGASSYDSLALSPDERRIALTSAFEIYVQDLDRGVRLPVTLDLPGSAHNPVWSIDGSRIIFSSNHGGDWDLYSIDPAGETPPTPLLRKKFDQNPMAIAPDGTVFFRESHPDTANDIWLLTPEGEARPVVTSPASESMPSPSPDGRLLAFTSTVSGRLEVYVQSLGGDPDRVSVSTTGGSSPLWSPDSRRLYFRSGNRMLVSEVETAPVLQASEPVLLFNGGWELSNWTGIDYVNYAVTSDDRFLMVLHHPDAIPTRINIIFNWFEELKRRVPAAP